MKRKQNSFKNSLNLLSFSLILTLQALTKPHRRGVAFMAAIVPMAIQAQISYMPIVQSQSMLASREISLAERYAVPSVNEVFKDNILLNLAYLRGTVSNSTDINWKEVTKPFEYSFILKPGQNFAFHDNVLPEYKDKTKITTNAHFSAAEGFKSDGYLVGDGVCHLASILYWAAKDAGLHALAPTNHNFMKIPEIPKKYGVSIYSSPDFSVSSVQNLYITNNKNNPIVFNISYKNDTLTVGVLERKNEI